MNKFLSITLFVLFAQLSFAQTADKTKGCIPLKVNFSAPSAAEYFWVFDDGTTSDKQNPEHIFTSGGNYKVVLYSSSAQSQEIGSVSVVVYPDLVVDISADETFGCTTKAINFSSNISKHGEVEILSYLWAYGDGGNSDEKTPSYTYDDMGIYDISLAIKTNYAECDVTIIEEDYITIEEKEADFKTDKISSCTAPATFVITNLSDKIDGYTYDWDFGDGRISTDFAPENITYNEEGVYVIELLMTAPGGCYDKRVIGIRVGPPLISFMMPDTMCLEATYPVLNESTGVSHFWDFGEGAEPRESTKGFPKVSYTTPGLKTVYYKNRQGICEGDTTFTVLVPEKISSFKVSPQTICGAPAVTLQLEADIKNMDNYYWNESDTSTTYVEQYLHRNPVRDSFFINEEEEFGFILKVDSEAGCEDTSHVNFKAQLPEAFFVPDSVIGQAPLTIGFTDRSTSSETIVERLWNMGDGTMIDKGNKTYVSHTFEEPGEYYVVLDIVNEAGCTDRSIYTKITVLGHISIVNIEDPSIPVLVIDGDGGNCIDGRPICVGETLDYAIHVNVPDFDLQVITDEGRFSKCWEDTGGSYTFNFPGTYPVAVSIEEQGFELLLDTIGLIEVVGARSEIAYSKTCEDIYTIELESKSLNAENIRWYHGNKYLGSREAFTYQFTEKGEHLIVLEATPEESFCEPDRDSVYIYVTEPKSEFTVEKIMCDNVAYELDATASTDVSPSCAGSYNWTFEKQRPRSVSTSTAHHMFLPGKQELTLTVRDVNGCEHSSSQVVEVYGIDLAFPLDTSICLPHHHVFDNTTTSDTTMQSWQWSFGSTEKSAEYTFELSDLDSLSMDTLLVTLVGEDILGCKDSLELATRIYKPISEIILDQETVCQGAPVLISADDFVEEGRSLVYDWNFSSGGTSILQSNDVEFLDEGEQDITLVYTELGTRCVDSTTVSINVRKAPQANFTTSVDDLDVICYPYTIEFENTTEAEGYTSYRWDFGNGSTSDLASPAISYDRGDFVAQLTARSNLGCQNTKQMNLELKGPDGNVELDKDVICLGETINVSLTNTVDVTSYAWDFGDGTVIENESKLAHTYAYKPPEDKTKIDWIVRSAETGCEILKTLPIQIHEVLADFELELGADYCKGLAGFDNLSQGGTDFLWDFGDGNTSEELYPVHVYEAGQVHIVTLTVTDPAVGCISQIAKEISVSGADIDFYSFPNVFSPNGDGRNDLFRPVIPAEYSEVVSIVHFDVYDRSGQKIYEEQGNESWDGSFKGSVLPSDVYAYFIELDIKDCKVVSDKGNVTIVR